MNQRIRTAVTMGVREFRRTPVLVVLLLILPAYFVGAFVLLVPETDITLDVGGTTTAVSMSAFAATLMTAVAVAILSGIVGLFLVMSSEAADGRLRLAGYEGLELVAARVVTLAAGVAIVSAVAVGVTVQVFQPANLWAFTVISGLLGLTYGVVGVVVGLVLDELGGVYAMLLLPLVDVLLFQNPIASDLPGWVEYLPGHHATVALFGTAFTTSVESSTVIGAISYAIALIVLSGVAFHHTTSVES